MSLKPALVAVAAAAAAAATLATAAAASADAEVQYLGQPGELVNGDIVQHWTVTDLKPSSDVIPYQPAGTLGRPRRPTRPSRATSRPWCPT